MAIRGSHHSTCGRTVPKYRRRCREGESSHVETAGDRRLHARPPRVRAALAHSDDLRRKPWRGAANPYAGHCYIACEAVKYLSVEPLRPHYMKTLAVNNTTGTPWPTPLDLATTHWFLRTEGIGGRIIDPTADQFKFELDYAAGRGCGFRTKQPSRRARTLIERALQDRSRATRHFPLGGGRWFAPSLGSTRPTSFILTGVGC